MRLIAPLSLILLLATSASVAAPPAGQQPVVVELYQSQGCSSCPPADAVLNALAARSDVIAQLTSLAIEAEKTKPNPIKKRLGSTMVMAKIIAAVINKLRLAGYPKLYC